MTDPLIVQSIYTDGACSGNPGPGGWGVVLYFKDGSRHEMGGRVAATTNNRMELQAAIEALQILPQWPMGDAAIPLYTDSEYVKKGITQWLAGWKRKGWKTAQGKTVLNQDLWQILDSLNSSAVEWRYVKAHAGHPGNEQADTIARSFSLGQPLSLRQKEAMTEFTADTRGHTAPETTVASAHRVQHLRELVETLGVADTIASQGYLITSSELADLMDVNAGAVTSRGDQWIWRNWEISRVRREGNQILWQLERINELS